MKRTLSVLAGLASLPAFASEWQEDFKPLPPGNFPLPRPQTATYHFGWAAVSAADATVTFSLNDKGEHEAKLALRTTGAARALWQMDAVHTAQSSASTLLPIAFRQTVKYRRETEKTKGDFTATEVVRLHESEPATQKAKPKRFKFPHLCDLHSALLLVRSQRLQEGDRYPLVVYPDVSPFLAHVTVAGRETIKVAGRRYPAIKMKLDLQKITKTRQLQPHTRFKNASVWISDDKDRVLLKIESEVYVGSVWMELQSVKFADR